MKLLATSDWHLGRLLFGVHLTDDQAVVLDQFVQLARDERPDAIIIAGDVFDRAVPPPEAIELLDDILARLVLDVKCPVVMIAGNHDSPVRLGFGGRLMAGSGLHVCGTIGPDMPMVVIEDRHGPVHIHPLPYAEPALVRDKLSDASATDQNLAMAARLGRIQAQGRRSVVVAHAFAAGCSASESERPLSLGGVETIDPGLFSAHSLVVLGHLHRPQTVREGRMIYTGSLLKYSFSECGDQKTVSLIELDAGGTARIERIGLAPRRDLRILEGFMAELMAGPPSEDYLLIRLRDKGAILDAMGTLRQKYPNLLHIERPELTGANAAVASSDFRRLTEADLFADFFQGVTGETIPDDLLAEFRKVVDDLRRQDREA